MHQREPDVHTPRVVNSAAEALALSQLSDVVYYRVSAERLVVDGDVDPIAAPDVSSGDDTSQQTVQIEVRERHDLDKMEVRCNLKVRTSEALYQVDAASRFDFSEAVELGDDARDEFVSRVGVMAAYPYLRESLHALASKLRLEAPVLGLLQGGRAPVERIEGEG